MLEALKKVFIGEEPESAETLAASIAELEAALMEAKQVSNQLHSEHDSKTLRLLADGADKTLLASRKKLADADYRIAELKSALATARARYAPYEEAARAAARHAPWEECRKLFDARLAAIKRMDRGIKELAAGMLETEALSNQLYAALPNRPAQLPPGFAGYTVQRAIELALFIESKGLFICVSAESPYTAAQRHHLVADNEQLHEYLMSFEHRAKGA